MATTAVIFGGKSCEHDISIITGLQVCENLNTRVAKIYIDKKGVWRLATCLSKAEDFLNEKKIKSLPQVAFCTGDNSLFVKKQRKLKLYCHIDFAYICLHGTNGEDGSVEGLLNHCNILHSGNGIAPSSLCMSKSMSKVFFKGLGLPQTKWMVVQREQMADFPKLERMLSKLTYPLITKPDTLGSSIGISVSQDKEQLLEALQQAFLFDHKVVVEQALTDFCDINCAALMHDGQVVVSHLEKPMSGENFLSFDEKYIKQCKRDVQNFPFKTHHSEKIKEATKKVFAGIGAKSVLRIDFLLCKKQDKVFLNEVNTIPGSLAYYLFRESMDFPKLLATIRKQAEQIADQEMTVVKVFDSEVLKSIPQKGKSPSK